MPLLAYIEIIDVRDLDEQIASFAIIAAASILVSWADQSPGTDNVPMIVAS
jgi:hypothetical protein